MHGFTQYLLRKKRIYLDHAASTPILSVARIAMFDAMSFIGNPGGIHAEAVAGAKSLKASRDAIAAELGCKGREVIFTHGLTAANNLAIIGFARKLEQTKRGLAGTHWIASAIDHTSVLASFAEVERMGGEVTFIEPNAKGIIEPATVSKALRPETVFISIGWANSEIGTVQPLAEIAAVVRSHEMRQGTQVIRHSDAGQAPLYRATKVHTLGVDLLSLGSHKFYGPHGIGALYISNRADIAGVSFGGGQERGLQAGTEDVPAAAGFSTAFVHIAREREHEAKRLGELRAAMVKDLIAQIPGIIINGDSSHTLPHLLNVSIPDMNSEYIVLALDHAGIAVSTKSACREGTDRTSHVVAALGGEPWRAQNTLRFSMGRSTTQADISNVVDILAKLLAKK